MREVRIKGKNKRREENGRRLLTCEGGKDMGRSEHREEKVKKQH